MFDSRKEIAYCDFYFGVEWQLAFYPVWILFYIIPLFFFRVDVNCFHLVFYSHFPYSTQGTRDNLGEYGSLPPGAPERVCWYDCSEAYTRKCAVFLRLGSRPSLRTRSQHCLCHEFNISNLTAHLKGVDDTGTVNMLNNK